MSDLQQAINVIEHALGMAVGKISEVSPRTALVDSAAVNGAWQFIKAAASKPVAPTLVKPEVDGEAQ